jgi:hypothetical protein
MNLLKMLPLFFCVAVQAQPQPQVRTRLQARARAPRRAAPVKPCAALLIAQPITHTPQQRYSSEVEEAGQIVKPGEMLPQLDTGFYIYLITANGEIMFARRYSLQSWTKNLATHKSLLEMYQRRSGAPDAPDIVAAGEFQIAFDQVVEVNNRSGNFRGDDETLKLGVEVLRAHGLPFSNETKIWALSDRAADWGHSSHEFDKDSDRLQAIKEIMISPRGRVLIDIYRRMYRLTRESFPEVPAQQAIQELTKVQNAGARATGKYDGYQSFYYPLQSAFSADGLEYGIWKIETFPDRGGHDGFSYGGPVQIHNVVVGGIKLPDAIKNRWRQLARDFQNLANVKESNVNAF